MHGNVCGRNIVGASDDSVNTAAGNVDCSSILGASVVEIGQHNCARRWTEKAT